MDFFIGENDSDCVSFIDLWIVKEQFHTSGMSMDETSRFKGQSNRIKIATPYENLKVLRESDSRIIDTFYPEH